MVKSREEPLIEFNPKLPRLSKNESEVLKLLVESGKLIVPIYKLQENPIFPGANFYPHDVSKEEISKKAKQEPQILSPYTVVEKINGKFVAIPYHKKYADLLRPVAEKLRKAAAITNNAEFSNYLKVQAKALTEGAYEEAIAVRLKMKPYILDISIGPIDYFDDELFFAKASYLAWVGVLDSEGTTRFNNYKTTTLSARRTAIVPKERIEPKKIEARVLDVVLLSGLMARTKFVGLNLPVDVNIVKKYGTEVVLFNQPNDLRMKEQILPTFNRIFSKAFREGFSIEDLRRGYLRCVALHELAHTYLFYKNSIKNLEDLFPSIYELAATILGLRLASTLFLKDRITDKQLQSMVVAFVSRNFYLAGDSKNSQFLFNYALGGIIFINFMLESSALKKSGDLITINFTKIFLSLHELSHILESLLSQGSRKDAEVFIKRYS